MNDNILKKATAKIDKKRQEADERARKNLQEAYKNEQFKNLYNKQKSLEIEIARKQAYGEPTSTKELTLVLQEIEFCLKKLGLNGTDIKPNYECKDCNDTGYVNGSVCNCLKKEINKELFALSGFSHSLATFEDDQFKSPAFELMKKWCNVKSDKINILICGHTGTGKTFLTECIASKLISQYKLVMFTTAFNLNNAMLNYHISFDFNREEKLSPYLNCEVLIIDDLGSEPMLKNVTQEYLYLIINERMLAKKPTVITTNLMPSDILNTYGERIFSRLSNKKTSILINLESEDLRLKK